MGAANVANSTLVSYFDLLECLELGLASSAPTKPPMTNRIIAPYIVRRKIICKADRPAIVSDIPNIPPNRANPVPPRVPISRAAPSNRANETMAMAMPVKPIRWTLTVGSAIRNGVAMAPQVKTTMKPIRNFLEISPVIGSLFNALKVGQVEAQHRKPNLSRLVHSRVSLALYDAASSFSPPTSRGDVALNIAPAFRRTSPTLSRCMLAMRTCTPVSQPIYLDHRAHHRASQKTGHLVAGSDGPVRTRGHQMSLLLRDRAVELPNGVAPAS